jgi:Fe-S cluster assembly protein SufD
MSATSSAVRATPAVAPPRDVFLTQVDRLLGTAGSDGPAFLLAVRQTARVRLAERGLPTSRDENWRFTNVSPIAKTAFARPDLALSARVSEEHVGAWRLPGCAAELVFVDGVHAPALSRVAAVDGLSVVSLRERLAAHDAEALAPLLTRLLDGRANVFADLNNALFEDGTFVEVAARTAVKAPVHLLFVASAQDVPTLAFPRILVRAGAGSEVTIVETWVGRGGPSRLTSTVGEVLVGENASVRRFKLQDEPETAFHVSSFVARPERNARFHDFSVSLGAALSRHDIDVDFAGEGGEATLEGILFADGDRTSDTHTRIDHARPHCTSRELYKGIVGGRGRGVFNGKVEVRAGAQKTDAAQTNKNLLLSREALVHSIPQLEILADDVKCRHGATTGQLDEDALFYLRARGLSEGAARGLLTVAFAADLVHRITLPALRERVSRSLLSRLPGAEEVREAAL